MRLAVITHPNDPRLRTRFGGYLKNSRLFYQIDAVLIAARWQGLRWFFTDPEQPFRPADAAFLHVDMSLIPPEYLQLAARYPKTINGLVADIRKRHVSRNLVDRTSDWVGQVLVKSDLNCRGAPERRIALTAAKRSGLARPDLTLPGYQLFDSIGAVPETVWHDPTRVVERFLPERLGSDHVLRVWSFLGDYERCSWYSAPDAIIKSGTISQFGTAEVPQVLRDERKRLGFDYGKFDYAEGPEGPTLFDANRTPGIILSRPEMMRLAAPLMGQALLRLMKG